MMQVSDITTGSPARKLILIKLADNANEDGFACPDINIIAAECEMHKSTVKKHIATMEGQGILTIIHRMEDVVSLPNHYQLHIMKRTHHEH